MVSLLTRRAAAFSGLAVLASCAPPRAAVSPDSFPSVRNGSGYIFLQAPLTEQVRGFLSSDFDKLIGAGATTIYLVMDSPGGVVVSAERIIAEMDRLHEQRGIRFITYNVGTVASASCYVFLAGQERYTLPRSAFLFHQASVVANGPLTGQVLQEASASVAEHERIFSRMLHTRTRLTDGEISSFLKRTVILSPDEARRDGITTGTMAFDIPKETRISRISMNRPPGASAPTMAPPQPTGGR